MTIKVLKNTPKTLFSIALFSTIFSSINITSAQEVDSVQVNNVVTRKINGHIMDAKTKEHLPGALIYTTDKKQQTVTDDNGFFEIELDDTVSTITVAYIGFETQIVNLKNLHNNHVMVSLKEEQSGRTLEGVNVMGRKKNSSISTLGVAKVEKIGTGELLKAACCNLSESFETTPSVDVGFTDAVSGYKQIQMLGLAGSNTSFTRENIPDIRGLAAVSGLTFTPGTFVESMQLSKGAGSVVNGFEGTAGQINVEWIKPFTENTPKLLLNGYQSIQGRTEGNLVYNHNFSKKLSTNVLLHGRGDWLKVDENKDGFLDNPLGNAFVAANRWFYFNENGLEIQAGFKGVKMDGVGGQLDYKADDEQVTGNMPWGYKNKVNRLETWAKIGKVYPQKPYKSMGLQLSAIFHNQTNDYGPRMYSGKQNSYYANYIFQTIINNTNNVIKFGGGALMDQYNEHYNLEQMKRQEVIPGAFVEYSYNWMNKINVVAGLRGDYHNMFGAFLTPRLHIRYAPQESTAIRASVGRAQRTANVLTENIGLMASNRNFMFNGVNIGNNLSNNPYPFKPEVAWNMGINLTQKFMLNYRDGSFGVDYYYTNFTNQVVVDLDKFNEVNFYNLEGKSFAHSLHAQLDYEPVRNMDLRLAYRFYDVKTDYKNSGLQEKPLVGVHRAFANIGYTTKNNWKFDYTLQWIGSKRLPQYLNTHNNLPVSNEQSQAYWLMNAQINKVLKGGAVNLYVGVENILNTMQHHLIINSDNPYGKGFDASIVWGSAMGRNIYAGFRWSLGGKQE
ncbi:MAG TPA: carboxypeptidase-like regulatory domain-containing protein [Edaphocola sp.]|nr:carboxypeptidase-like regulatory domain-containing protein [Edaphocola sp.]